MLVEIKYRFALTITFSLLVFVLLAQDADEGFLNTTVKVYNTNKERLETITVIYTDLSTNQVLKTATVGGSAFFRLKLNSSYLVVVSGYGYYTKTIEINTSVNRIGNYPAFYTEIEVTLFDNCENNSARANILEYPIGKIKYNNSKTKFEYDFAYTAEMTELYNEKYEERCLKAEKEKEAIAQTTAPKEKQIIEKPQPEIKEPKKEEPKPVKQPEQKIVESQPKPEKQKPQPEIKEPKKEEPKPEKQPEQKVVENQPKPEKQKPQPEIKETKKEEPKPEKQPEQKVVNNQPKPEKQKPQPEIKETKKEEPKPEKQPEQKVVENQPKPEKQKPQPEIKEPKKEETKPDKQPEKIVVENQPKPENQEPEPEKTEQNSIPDENNEAITQNNNSNLNESKPQPENKVIITPKKQIFDQNRSFIYIQPKNSWPSELRNHLLDPNYKAKAIGTFAYTENEQKREFFIEDVPELREKFPKQFEAAFKNWDYLIDLYSNYQNKQ